MQEMQTIDFSRRAVVALAVSVLALSACGGGGGGGNTGGTVPVPAPSSSAPPPTATPGPPGSSGQTITTNAGSVTGQTSGSFSAPANPSGQPIDGVTCDPSMSNNYHVHPFLGVYYNGTLMALPAGIGMQNPQAPSNGFVNVASCFYHLHTHDRSGLLHIEDPDPNNLPITASMYTLKTFLDIWGITADANHFGPFNGPVRVYTSGQVYRGNTAGNTVSASTYTYYGNDPSSIPLYSHEVIIVEVGPTYPAALPNVYFYEQY